MNSYRFLAFALLSLVIIFASCNKDDDNVDENTVVLADTSLYTGELIVQVNRWDGNNVPSNWNFEVNLYFSREDADDNIPYLSVNTNNQGEAYFGYLVMGNYYLKGFGSDGGQVYETYLTPSQIMPRRTNFTTIIAKQP